MIMTEENKGAYGWAVTFYKTAYDECADLFSGSYFGKDIYTEDGQPNGMEYLGYDTKDAAINDATWYGQHHCNVHGYHMVEPLNWGLFDVVDVNNVRLFNVSLVLSKELELNNVPSGPEKKKVVHSCVKYDVKNIGYDHTEQQSEGMELEF